MTKGKGKGEFLEMPNSLVE